MDKPEVLSVEMNTCLGKFVILNSQFVIHTLRTRNSVQDIKTKPVFDHFLRWVPQN